MEPKFRTSFIPKKTLSTVANIQRRSGGGSLGVITLLSLIIVLGAVVLSVGVFLYQKILESNITRKTVTLNRARAAFEPTLIQELVRVDSRLNAANVILNQHITPSVLFESLEKLTLKSVQFRDFNLTRISGDKISVSMKGIAKDFRGVALQADVFGKSKIIKDPIFSNLNLNQAGNAVFSFSAFVDTSLIKYVKHIDTGAVN
ncbi:MAG TPA: hypothetical protein ENI63_00575 [Candidatus Kaiserbacteria bacterium]|nr:hypothetical protein [Candidatus Kaiserbacteria bacterium]